MHISQNTSGAFVPTQRIYVPSFSIFELVFLYKFSLVVFTSIG